jgi:hypothetical protein
MGCLKEFYKSLIIILYGNVFQNPELFPTQVSLSPEQSTLACIANVSNYFSIYGKSKLDSYMCTCFFRGGGAAGGVSHFRGRGVKLVDPIINGQFFSKKKNQIFFSKIKN